VTITRPHSILLDAEALSALALGEKRMQAWAEVARRTDSILYASTATLAEVTDGTPRDARVRQAAKVVRLVDVSAAIGYRAGAFRGNAATGRRKARDLTVDALVAATASDLNPPVVVLTSDQADLELLLSGTDVKVEVI
jgi:predicted nucleic acid-binding protein